MGAYYTVYENYRQWLENLFDFIMQIRILKASNMMYVIGTKYLDL